MSSMLLEPEQSWVCKVYGKRFPHTQAYRRGEVNSPALLSESRNAQNTRNTLKEEVFSAFLRVLRDSDNTHAKNFTHPVLKER